MTYPQTLDYLNAIPSFQQVGTTAYKGGLENIINLCEVLGNPQEKFSTIHVAGTNGKGSSCHFLANFLSQKYAKVGLFTSPFLTDFREQIAINQVWISEAKLAEIVTKMLPHITKISPTFFEITVAIAFSYFAEAAVEIAVIETGLGGLLDSTNIIKPLASLITNISYEHQAILGNTLEEIAFQKAGIIKANTPVVVSEYQPEVAHIFEEKAREMNAQLYFGDKKSSLKTIKNAPYQTRNLQGVLKLLKVFFPDFEFIDAPLNLKGRWQTVGQNPEILLDGAHNEAGLRVLMQGVESLNYQNLYAIVAFGQEKEVEKLLQIFPENTRFVFCQFQTLRSMSAKTLQMRASKIGFSGKVYPNLDTALANTRKEAQTNDLILITGSLYLVGEFK